MKRIRTLLVDDNRTFLDSLAELLSDYERVEVVGRATSGVDAYHLVGELAPDLVLMDFFMVGMNGLEATQLLRTHPLAPKVIVLSLYSDRVFDQAARRAGAESFVRKQDLPEDLFAAISRIFPAASAPQLAP